MAKLIKGDSVQNIITDGDVIVTSPSKIGKTLDEVLVEQQSDIDKLKSNVKYIYAYGGVGGSGSGGSGSGSGNGPIKISITLNGSPVDKSGGTIVLDGAGKYMLYVRVTNAGGKNLFMGYTTNGSTVTVSKRTIPLNGDNKYTIEMGIQLNSNGVLNIAFCDDEGNDVGDYYSQKYIVDSDRFDVTLNYVDLDGNIQQYVSEPYECFVNDIYRKQRHIKLSYSIFLTDYDKDSVNVKCSIDGIGDIYSGADNNVEIPLDSILINKEPILQDKYLGTYTLHATLTYIIMGSPVVRKKSFLFSIIPSGLFINIRTAGDVLYDSVKLLKDDTNEDGYPYKYISQGSSLIIFSKVFEGSLGTSNRNTYDVIYKSFDMEVDENGSPKLNDDGDYIWNELEKWDNESLIEQIESKSGVAVTFSTPGIKKIEISTIGRKDEFGIEKVFKKYVYVKEFESVLNWYNINKHTVISDNYFRANQGINTYYNFPSLPSGEGVMSLLISSNPIELSRDSWFSSITENVCTSISFGIQVSNINSENAKILDIYTSTSGQNYEYSLRTERLFTDVTDEKNKIAIPTDILDKNKNSQYHLVQIIRNYVGLSSGQPVFEDSLYIDGMLESVNRNTTISPLLVKKIKLNNINICYNLINIQYISPTHKVNEDEIKFNPDGYAYQYWLCYKEKYVNSNSEGSRLNEGELFMVDNMHQIFFDGTNVVIDNSDIVVNIAKYSDLPTVVFGYNCTDGENYKSIDSFMNMMWDGRHNGKDDTFKSRKIDLYWIPPRIKNDNKKLNDFNIKIPSGLIDSTDVNEIGGEWEIDLQGTSTMRNRIKNYSLRIKSENENGKILFSPNFDINNNRTFLPDIEWTIKADIADSAHANNTSIGKFVNDFCTSIDTNIPDINDDIDAQGFIKNTLEGIPVLLYFMCTDKDKDGVTNTKIYYFGIYNFNLGRTSHYNLGYTGGIVDSQEGRSDFIKVFKNIKNETVGKYATNGGFTFAVGEGKLTPNIAIGEIQDNYAEFDFHQYHDSLLFNQSGNNIACMFGTDSKIIASGNDKIGDAKNALSRLVRSVAKAGKYCFIQLGREKDLITSADITYDDAGNKKFDDNCINRYLEGKLPDPKWQKTYVSNADENGSYVRWIEADAEFNDVNEDDLKKLITRYLIDGEPNKPILNFTSAAEYFTICMAFGMVDSVLKNMNLKNFRSRTDGNNFYCAFYDMDCALGEANDGEEKISYLAATDYWYSNIDTKTYKVSKILKKNDYWDSINGGHGFDFTSSYLFAVVKYAKAIFGEKYYEDLVHYPQNFWGMLRRPYIDENDKGGGLQNADYFIKNYFKSGITTTFEYLASLNYRVKYLYKGDVLVGDGDKVENKFLANAAAFNGSRRIKVKNWLSKRLRFMDLMMNVNDLSVEISNGINYPGPGNYSSTLSNNNDIAILHSAFDIDGHNTAISTHDGVEVSIYAPKHTPFIFRSGSNAADIYLLPGGVDYPNKITLYTKSSMLARFFGSGMFTSVDKIETMFTSYRSIVSENIEKITYGDTPVIANSGEFFISAKSVTEIELDIPNMGGKLTIDENCQSLMKLNIANSNFYGQFIKLANLQEVNISGVNSNAPDGIYVSGSKYLTGEKFHISGSDENHKTSLSVLDISDVTGNFVCEYTNINKIRITNNINRKSSDFDTSMLSEFYISGDKNLEELTLSGFRKVHINKCNNLKTLYIDDALEELYINLSKGVDEDGSKLETIFLNKKKDDIGDSDSDSDNIEEDIENIDRTGIFDFTNYPNLKRVTLMNCDHLVHVKLPDKDIETDGMSNNPKLKWIDTGLLPAFRDTDNKLTNGVGDGYIEGVGVYSNKLFPIYSVGPKLILCSDSVFSNCPNYAMLRSDWDKSKEMIDEENNIAYTNITVSESCTSLANTFYMSGYLSERTYIDEYSDKKVTEPLFNMNTAIRFIEKCVPDNVKGKITSLSGCFRGCGNGIKYDIGDAASEIANDDHMNPSFEKYILLDDISGMFYGTNVSFISKQLLDLPYLKNVTGNSLSWGDFISRMSSGISISVDALENISYRLTSYSNIRFTLYEYDSSKYIYKLAGTETNKFKITDFFHHRLEEGNSDSDSRIIPFNNISSINSLNFGDQYIDFRDMFELFPKVTSISNFLNGSLRKYNIDELLLPCKKITSISDSFCDDGVNDAGNPQKINLYTFFNWEGNTTIGVTKLFEGSIVGSDFSNGFRIKKTITYDDFKKVLNRITIIANNNKDLKNLTNIFSYCTITEYDKATDKEIKFNEPLLYIENISNLFYNCTSNYVPTIKGVVGSNAEYKGVYEGGVLDIRRSFFEKLPKFTIAQRTFANTCLCSSLTYDFFCKRGNTYIKSEVLSSENQTDVADLYEYVYSSNIINLKECFYNVKFVNCKNWFDPNDNVSIVRNYIKYNNSTYDERGREYYIYNGITETYEKYVLDNNVIDDCLDNYTDFVKQNLIGDNIWYNHDLLQDCSYYGNFKNDNKPFEEIASMDNTIQKTYCCLPPDFLYGCSNNAVIDGIFANSNIIGVIPRNLTKKIKSKSIPNIFKNVNIMPNLEYYYDKNRSLDNKILGEITETIDGGIGDDYRVVFRDEKGILKKRKPVNGDRNLGQFVYVPHNFTTSNSLMNVFNFRYNLPKHWNMPNKPTNVNVDWYKSTKEFNDAIKTGELTNDNLLYHTQYYFTTDKSVKWDNIRDAKSVFISDDQDIEFSNNYDTGRVRVYYDGNISVDDNYKNAWTLSSNVSTINGWVNNIDKFYIDLNLCGQKNDNNMLEDYGCPIKIKNIEVYLDNFISGILTIFLNGRVFYDEFAINDLTTANHKNNGGSYVIDYYGFGKNIILPKYTTSPLDDEFVFITSSKHNVVYFDFMINDNDNSSKPQYKVYLGIGESSNGNNLNEDKNKYTFKK